MADCFRDNLAELAYQNPRLAWAVAKSSLMGLRPRLLQMRVVFNNPGEMTLSDTLEVDDRSDVYIYDLEYQIRKSRGQYGASVLQSQERVAYAQNSGIEIQLELKRGNTISDLYGVTDDPAPIEMLARLAGFTRPPSFSRGKFNWVLSYQQTFKATFTMTDPPADLNAYPIEVILGLNGIRLQSACYNGTSLEESCEHLSRDFGIIGLSGLPKVAAGG